MVQQNISPASKYFNDNPIYVYISAIPSIVLFIIIIILIFLIYMYKKKNYVYGRTAVFSFLFITSILSFAFNTSIFGLKDINKDNKNISKIYLIVLSIILITSILYLILSHTFGCL